MVNVKFYQSPVDSYAVLYLLCFIHNMLYIPLNKCGYISLWKLAIKPSLYIDKLFEVEVII